MKLSAFGTKIGKKSGIGQLMDDLGRAMEGGRDYYMLGGGNPAHIPAVQQRFREAMMEIMETEGGFERAIGNYDTPQGNAPFIDALVGMLRREFNWEISEKNIALTNGSQSAFFVLFNMFAGDMEDGVRRKVLLPLAPEYIGYADLGLLEDFFVGVKPEIDHLDDHIYKYGVDFDALEITDEIGAICVSRPTNPTGNVLTNDEIAKLRAIARENEIPMIIDNAYGTPFPNIIFTEAEPVWDDNTIVCMSLSKLGLPAARTGIVIASEEIIEVISSITAVMNLAPTGVGASLATEIVRTGEILEISRNIIQPYYQDKATRAVAQLKRDLDGVNYHIHKPEGALFLWLWFEGMPITSQELYERLKDRGVLVVSGHYFFPGVDDQEWAHRNECIRVTYSQSDNDVEKGLAIIAEEVKKAYAGN